MKKVARFLKDVSKPCAFGALSALLLVPAFPPYAVTPLVFVGLVPLIWGAFSARDYKAAFFAGFACMVLFVVLGFHWISYVAVSFGGLPWIVGQVTLLLFALFGELQFLFFALLCHAYFKKNRIPQRPLGAVVVAFSLACVYVALDWLYPKIFPDTLGHALIAWPRVAQIAEVTGAYGLSILIVAFNLFVFFALRGAKSTRKTALAAVVCLAALFAGFFVWGGHRIRQLEAVEKSFTRQFRFAAIQADIGDTEKLAGERGYANAISKILETYQDLSVEAAAEGHPELIIWPETAFPLLYTHFTNPSADAQGAWGRAFVQNVARQTQSDIYFGGYSARGRKDYNTGFLVNKDGELADYYQKSILLAFGEYVPLGPFSDYVQKLVPSIADFGRGDGPKILTLNGVRLAPQICYEGLIPEFSRTAVKMGADILLNITNDSWFGDTTEPHLHLALTRFRSIELRRPMIRSTNTGISTLIAMTGESRFATPVFESAILMQPVPVPGPGQNFPKTFFLRFGEIFARIACLVAALFLLVLFLRRR